MLCLMRVVRQVWVCGDDIYSVLRIKLMCSNGLSGLHDRHNGLGRHKYGVARGVDLSCCICFLLGFDSGQAANERRRSYW